MIQSKSHHTSDLLFCIFQNYKDSYLHWFNVLLNDAITIRVWLYEFCRRTLTNIGTYFAFCHNNEVSESNTFLTTIQQHKAFYCGLVKSIHNKIKEIITQTIE